LTARFGAVSVGAASVGALAALVLLTGCQHPSRPAASSPVPSLSDVGSLPPVATARITSTRGLLLPIEKYDATAAERTVVGDAIALSVTRCMAGFGLSWSPEPARFSTPVPQLARAYGVADPLTAASRGYHVPTDSRPATAPSGQHLTPEQVRVYSGARDASGKPVAARFGGKKVPVGGCAQQGLVSIVADPDLDPDSVADQILISMGERARKDVRVVAAIAAWSSCMRRAGYQFSDPLEAAARATAAGPEPTAVEIRTAVADLGCKNKANLLGIWYAVDAGYERLAIRQDSKQLAAVRSAWRAAVLKAAALLGRPVPPPNG
jgi:hypothetical protein